MRRVRLRTSLGLVSPGSPPPSTCLCTASDPPTISKLESILANHTRVQARRGPPNTGLPSWRVTNPTSSTVQPITMVRTIKCLSCARLIRAWHWPSNIVIHLFVKSMYFVLCFWCQSVFLTFIFYIYSQYCVYKNVKKKKKRKIYITLFKASGL